MTLYRILFIIIIYLLSFMTTAQDNISAGVDVRFEGVDIRRQNSELWLPLSQGALAFIGAGDTIRTNAEGRVDILLNEYSHMLLLSNTELTIGHFSDDDGMLSLSAQLNGNAVIETTEKARWDELDLMLNDMSVIQPAYLMGIWSFPDTTDAVTVAEGSARIRTLDDVEVEIPVGSGFLAETDRIESVAFKPDWHAAGLEASLYGCEGVVRTSGGVPLLVRTGPGRGFQAMGTLDVSRIVQLMGVTETTGWTRIQFLTGFGWIQSTAIESDCDDLSVFSDEAPEEKFITIVNVMDEELAILEPFFQTPAENAFVYKFARVP